MTQLPSFKANWCSTPGSSILDLIEHKNIPKANLPNLLNISKSTLEDLLNGFKPIDEHIAKNLSISIGGSIDFWITREKQYRDDLKRIQVVPKEEVLKNFDTGYVIQSFNFKNPKNTEKLFLSFFDTPDFPSWKNKYEKLFQRTLFKKSEKLDFKKLSLATWLRAAEIQSKSIAVENFDTSKLIASLDKIKELTKEKDPKIFIPQLKGIFARCGVKFVVLRTPTGCPVSGAIRLYDNNPLLILSFRFRTDDHFWFTVFHEIGHLVQHQIGELYLEREINEKEIDIIEKEANLFAERILLSGLDSTELERFPISHRDLIRRAVRLNISPGILVGQLQHHGIVSYKHFNNLKRRYTWEEIFSTQ